MMIPVAVMGFVIQGEPLLTVRPVVLKSRVVGTNTLATVQHHLLMSVPEMLLPKTFQVKVATNSVQDGVFIGVLFLMVHSRPAHLEMKVIIASAELLLAPAKDVVLFHLMVLLLPCQK